MIILTENIIHYYYIVVSVSLGWFDHENELERHTMTVTYATNVTYTDSKTSQFDYQLSSGQLRSEQPG